MVHRCIRCGRFARFEISSNGDPVCSPGCLLQITAGFGSVDKFRVVASLVRVVDGDTVVVDFLNGMNNVHIRLMHMDTPETSQKEGNDATEALVEMITGRKLSVQLEKDTDRYGRTLGILFANGENVNHAMVRVGWAWAYDKDKISGGPYAASEAKAREDHLGLWGIEDYDPVRPHEWRRMSKQEKKESMGSSV